MKLQCILTESLSVNIMVKPRRIFPTEKCMYIRYNNDMIVFYEIFRFFNNEILYSVNCKNFFEAKSKCIFIYNGIIVHIMLNKSGAFNVS
jgi:hypothetical protein